MRSYEKQIQALVELPVKHSSRDRYRSPSLGDRFLSTPATDPVYLCTELRICVKTSSITLLQESSIYYRPFLPYQYARQHSLADQ